MTGVRHRFGPGRGNRDSLQPQDAFSVQGNCRHGR